MSDDLTKSRLKKSNTQEKPIVVPPPQKEKTK